MEIGKVIEKAFKYPWKNKALWFYGVLIAIFSGGSSLNYTPEEGEVVQLQSYFNTFDINNSEIIMAIMVIGFVVFCLGVLGTIIASWSQAAIVNGVSQIEQGKKIKRKEIGKTGKRIVWNLIVLSVFIPLLVFLALIVVVVPFVVLVVALPSPINIAVGVFFTLLFIFLLIPALVYYGFVWALAQTTLVLDKTKPIEALKNARVVIKGKFWYTFLFSIIMSIINGMIMMLAVIPFFIFGGLAIFLWSKAIVAAVIFAFILFFYLVFFLALSGYFSSVLHTGWVVWWLELKKSKEKK